MSLPETLCGLLLMPGTLCVLGPQGIQLERMHLQPQEDLFQEPPENSTQIFELNVFCHRL